MGTKRLDKISDYARHGFNLRIVCRGCGRASVIDARALTAKCAEASLSLNMDAVQRRLKCQACHSRDVELGPVDRADTVELGVSQQMNQSGVATATD